MFFLSLLHSLVQATSRRDSFALLVGGKEEKEYVQKSIFDEGEKRTARQGE